MAHDPANLWTACAKLSDCRIVKRLCRCVKRSRSTLSEVISQAVVAWLDRGGRAAQSAGASGRYGDPFHRQAPRESRQRVMESATQFIMQKLKLKVNETKSAVA